MMQLQDIKILVPTDFSEASFYGIEQAKQLARQFNGELYLTHVVESLEYNEQWNFTHTPVEDVGSLLRKQVREKLQHLSSIIEQEGVSTHIVMMTGVPYVQLSKYADQHDMDMIVITTAGKKRLEKMILGSTTERLLRVATRPVMVVRAPDSIDKMQHEKQELYLNSLNIIF
jgi:nucleotide-binding universal stress UspA family protein